MCIFKQKLKLFWIFFAIISLVALVVCLVLSIIEKNGSYVYSWLITICFIVISKYIHIKTFNKTYSEDNHRSKKKKILAKFISLHIASSAISMMPFFIVSLVVICLGEVNDSYIFNIWVTLSLTIAFTILWISFVSVVGYNTRKNNIQSYGKEKIDG